MRQRVLSLGCVIGLFSGLANAQATSPTGANPPGDTPAAAAPSAPATEPASAPPAVTYQAPPPAQSANPAAPANVAEPPDPAADPTADPTAHLHDGFYLRLAIGLGYLSNTITPKANSAGLDSATIDGTTLGIEILLGGALVPGVVLGAGLWADPMMSPQYETSSGSGTISSDLSVQLSRLGAFVDVYPSPTGGFHVQGNVALAAFSLSDKETNVVYSNAKGLGLGASAGYEWWIGKQWGAGVMGRFVYASVSADEESHSVIYPSLLSTFTFN